MTQPVPAPAPEPPPPMPPTRPTVTRATARLIIKLHAALSVEFNGHFAYTIQGNGLTVAAFNKRDGRILPVATEDALEEKQRQERNTSKF